MTPVILDTDIGGDIDDTWALALLMRSPELSLQAITTVSGDTRYRAALCEKMLKTAGYPSVPIGLGSCGEMSEAGFSQRGWLGDYSALDYDVKNRCAADMMIKVIMDSPVPVTILAIGPFSNIAEALQKEPAIAGNAKIIGVGGSVRRQYFGVAGNCTEYNILADIPAAKHVFQAGWREMLLVPLDVCGNIILQGARYEKVKNSPLPVARMVVENYRLWLQTRLKLQIPTPPCDPEMESSLIADAAAIALAVCPELVQTEFVPLLVTESGETRIDPTHGTSIRIASKWKNVEHFYDFVTDRLLSEMKY